MPNDSLAVGSRLGPYEVLSAVGAGGMGEVYRATDTRLGRIVALKILPPHLAADPDLPQRFEREARAIAGLSHPHVCTLHDIGRDNGIAYLVMEFLEGKTLAAALESGPLPLDRALKTAIEIADALDAAHRAGIVHRDLKPGNVMLTASGVKVLDFGLARIGVQASGVAGQSLLPTAKSTPLTARGTILGTFQYMSPEQLEGQEADARTDIFAFGTVLYEMVTGRRAFEGTSQASLIGAILKDEPPPITASQPVAPPALDHVVRRCLAKRPDERWQSIRDARHQLEWVLSGDAQKQVVIAPPASARRWREWAAWGLAAAGVAAAIALLLVRSPTNLIGPLVQLDLPTPSELKFRPQAMMAVPSPDGHWMALSSHPSDVAPIQLQDLRDSTRQVLNGTEAGVAPFWSPDSQKLAFFQDGRLITLDIAGGTPQVVCQCPNAAGSWLDADTILYSSPLGTAGGINRLRISTRTSDKATELDVSRGETAHQWPSALPDGRHFMFVAVHGAEARWRTYIGSVDSRDRIELPIESNVSYVEPGYLLFARAGSLMAQAFDLAGLQLRGEPFRVTSVVRNPEVPYRFFASRNGVLAVWLATPVPPSQLEWVDRNGTVLQSVGPAADYSSPSLSPDNTRLAVGIRPRAVGATRDLFLFDLQQGGRRQLTRDPADDMNPAWALDNETLYFTSNRNGPRRLYRMNSRTPGREEPVPVDGTAGLHEMSLESISADGLVYNHNYMGANSPGQRLELLPFAGGSPKTLIDRPGLLVKDGQVSPDGRWLAYTQTEGGLPLRHVVVSSIAVPERARVVSVKGGHSPQWNPGTQELIYLEGESRFMAVRFTTTSGEFKPEAPRFLFERALQPGVFRNQYVVDKTGQRFLINAATGTAREPHFTMFADWRALLPNP